jgi:hypothetical protein
MPAKTYYLSNPETLVVAGTDLRTNASSIELTLGYEPLDATSFGDGGTIMQKGLQTVSGTLTLFVEYGASEVEGIIFGEVGEGDTTITVKKGSGAIAADNPEYQISNTMIAEAPVVYTINELQVMEVSFSGGTWVRDVTP